MKCAFNNRYLNRDKGELHTGRVCAETFLTWYCNTGSGPSLTNRYMKILSSPGRAGGEP